MTKSELLSSALRYAELGYCVFPCRDGDKRPQIKAWPDRATTDISQIEEWWSQWPNANIGLSTEGLLVVDIDGADNPWLADSPEKSAGLAVAPLSITARGGRHLVFRDSVGDLRNSTGKLAAKVDTRATGGYIVVPPSRLAEGGEYRWAADRGLDVLREQLPPLPGWLTSELQAQCKPELQAKAASKDADCSVIPEGHRNSTLASIAGYLRRAGMSQTEIEAALRQVNRDRCKPPIIDGDPDGDPTSIARSVARYAPNEAMATKVFCRRAAIDIRPQGIADLFQEHPHQAEPIIDGLLRRGETANIICAPKHGKSWLAHGLALSIATGREWLGRFTCRPGRVLLIDNELLPGTLGFRISAVAGAMGMALADYKHRLEVLRLRGRLLDLTDIEDLLLQIEPGTYDTIILDAFYRSLPAGVSENDNGAIAGLYNMIDATTARHGCAWLNIHHASKGSQGNKATTDMGAGAGSQSRAADAHIVLRPHEEPGCVVLEAVVRSFPLVQPLALCWHYPVWQPANDLDTSAVLDRLDRKQRRQLEKDKEGMAEIVGALNAGRALEPALRRRIGMGRERFARLAGVLEHDGEVRSKETKAGGHWTREYELVEHNLAA